MTSELANEVRIEQRDVLLQRLGESYNKLGTAFSYIELESTEFKNEMRDVQKKLRNLIDQIQG